MPYRFEQPFILVQTFSSHGIFIVDRLVYQYQEH